MVESKEIVNHIELYFQPIFTLSLSENPYRGLPQPHCLEGQSYGSMNETQDLDLRKIFWRNHLRPASKDSLEGLFHGLPSCQHPTLRMDYVHDLN